MRGVPTPHIKQCGTSQLPVLTIQVVWSCGGSLVVTTDCKLAVPDSNLAISPAYNALPVLRQVAVWDGNFTVGYPLRGGAEESSNKRTSGLPKTIKEKKNIAGSTDSPIEKIVGSQSKITNISSNSKSDSKSL